jgi:hypothetical protein
MRYLYLTIAALAFALPAAALAAGSPSPSALANQSCKNLQTQLGATFKTTYGTNVSRSNAFGRCVTRTTSANEANAQNASKTCKAWQADPNFATVTTNNPQGLTFNALYGTNGQAAKGKSADANALGKCVSTLAKQSANQQTHATIAAVKTCKTLAASTDPTVKAQFAHDYGTGRNAFGACVAKQSKHS